MNPISWVEIPATNMERAMKFYDAIFGWSLKIDVDNKMKMSFFPFSPEQPGASAALIKMGKFYKPAKAAGALVYLACADILATEKLITDNGGKVMINKTQISPDHGYMSVFIDSEGNRMALHSHF